MYYNVYGQVTKRDPKRPWQHDSYVFVRGSLVASLEAAKEIARVWRPNFVRTYVTTNQTRTVIWDPDWDLEEPSIRTALSIGG